MKKFKQMLSAILIICLCLFPVSYSRAVSYPAMGVVSSSTGAKIYDGAGTKGHNYIETLANNTAVMVIGEEIDWEGDLWYIIKYGTNNSKQGYIYSGRCKLIGSMVDDPAFNAELAAQGFPESYQAELKKLHSLYPNWKFKALHTGLDWSAVLDNETTPAKSLIPKNYSDSYKSYEMGSYNWDTNTFVVHDTGGWVDSSREYLAYHMDPRNFMNDTHVFQFLSLAYSSNETTSGVSSVLSGTFMGGAYPSGLEDSGNFASYADAFVKAAKESGVSAFHLASRAVQEQGVSGTTLGHGTVSGYTGYYNLFNYGASGNGASEVITNGAKYAQKEGWNTPYKAIVGAAKKIAAGYIKKGQVNTYLQKFDVVDGGNGYYAYQYMQNILAPSQEAINTKSAYTTSQLNTLNLEFTIPVYNNMPPSACQKPSQNGNNNNLLNSLSVSGYSIGTFNRYSYSYGLIVGNTVKSITINAVPSDSGATVSGAGVRTLIHGENAIVIKVTASNGISRSYTINVFREGTLQYITSEHYKIDSYITGVSAGTTVETAMSRIILDSCTAKLFDVKGTHKTTGNIATGDVLKLYVDNKVINEYPFVIYGDVNGNGIINTLDLLSGHKHLLGINNLTGAQLEACDMNKSGDFSSVDLLRGQKYLLGIIDNLQN